VAQKCGTERAKPSSKGGSHAIKGGPAVTKEEKEEEERQAARERVYAAFGGESHIEYGTLVGADGST
jgi:hypothetical protein